MPVQHRLGALGFPPWARAGQWAWWAGSRLRANLGLHDVILALQWVVNNIGKFGGDPDRITLLGVEVRVTMCLVRSLETTSINFKVKCVLTGTLLNISSKKLCEVFLRIVLSLCYNQRIELKLCT